MQRTPENLLCREKPRKTNGFCGTFLLDITNMMNNWSLGDQKQELTVSADLPEGFVFAMARRI